LPFREVQEKLLRLTSKRIFVCSKLKPTSANTITWRGGEHELARDLLGFRGVKGNGGGVQTKVPVLSQIEIEQGLERKKCLIGLSVPAEDSKRETHG